MSPGKPLTTGGLGGFLEEDAPRCDRHSGISMGAGVLPSRQSQFPFFLQGGREQLCFPCRAA